MTTDFRALCAELVEKLDELNCHYNVPSQSAMIERARAALGDEPAVPEGREPVAVTGQPRPTDDEVEALADQLGLIRGHANHPCGFWINDGDAGALARAVLARWGNNVPAPLANGEVGELIGKLVEVAPALAEMGWDQHAQRILRAAELLQRQVLVPVSVSERLPGPGDCLDEGWAWFFSPRVGWRQAVLPVSAAYTHWLPAHALPLPEVSK